MKKLLLFISALSLQISLSGQSVPNGTFENWNSTSFNEPTGWFSGNFRSIQQSNVITGTKVSGFSGFALRLQTVVSGQDTLQAYAANTDPGCKDPSQWAGGVPFSQQPTAITGYFRYNLPGNDTALLMVIFKKNFVVVGNNLIKIRGTGNQPTFTAFSFPINVTSAPDTLIIAATSSNLMGSVGIQNGSFLELDNLGFTGATQTIPNGNFENWTSFTYNLPSGWDGWSGNINGITKTTSSYAGSYALRLETLTDQCGGANSSGITTGTMTNNNGPKGGLPYTKQQDTLCGYYKYVSMGGDTAQISLSLTKNFSNVGGGVKYLLAAANYTYFEMPFSSFTMPDTMRIDMSSSKWPVTTTNLGSVLYLDNLHLKSQPLGIINFNLSEMTAVYPNPNTGIFNVVYDTPVHAPVQMQIFDQTGRLVLSDTFYNNGEKNSVDITVFGKGLYLVKTEQMGKVSTKRIIVQ